MEQKSDFAIVGLGVMGSALAQNAESQGFRVSVYNRNSEKTDAFIKNHENKNFFAAKDYKTFVMSIKKPRTIMIMVKAGDPVDYVIKDLLDHLEEDDIIIDGGNSHFTDTKRRESELKQKGIHFVGCGVSGGEEGALKGPSLMPGGSQESWKSLQPIFEKMAAKDFSNGPCVTHVGPDGAGHYVKMVHNGIEYGVMQLMAEVYDIYHTLYKQSPEEIAKIFENLNKEELQSFLFEIGIEVLKKKDDLTDNYLVNNILDKAGQKGTGKWTSAESLNRGLPLPTITESVYARYVSGEKERRVILSKELSVSKLEPSLTLEEFNKIIFPALKSALFSTYAQGYDLVERVSKEENWNIDLSEVSRIWEGGCIIRSKLLKIFHDGFKSNHVHPFLIPEIKESLEKDTNHLRQIVSLGSLSGVPVAALSGSLTYIDTYKRENLPANLIQGLRDYFGAHTYKRKDKDGDFHTNWN